MKVMIALTSVLVGSLLGITHAHADTAEVPREVVNIGDLRQDTPEGLATVYNRIHAAAERVCAPLASYDRLNVRQHRCVEEAMERASSQLPELARNDLRRRKIGHG